MITTATPEDNQSKRVVSRTIQSICPVCGLVVSELRPIAVCITNMTYWLDKGYKLEKCLYCLGLEKLMETKNGEKQR